MKSITIHNLDAKTASMIEKRAQETGKSLNKTIKELLREKLGLKPSKKKDNDDFDEFLGIWNQRECDEFELYIRDFRRIDEGDW